MIIVFISTVGDLSLSEPLNVEDTGLTTSIMVRKRRANLKIVVSNTVKKDTECVAWGWGISNPHERKLLHVGPLTELKGIPGITYDLLMVSRNYYSKLLTDDIETKQ